MKEVEVGGGRGARQDSTFSPVLETLALTHLSFSVADPPPPGYWRYLYDSSNEAKRKYKGRDLNVAQQAKSGSVNLLGYFSG